MQDKILDGYTDKNGWVWDNKPKSKIDLQEAIETLCNALREENSILYDLWHKQLRLSLLQQVWDKRLSPEFKEPYDFEKLADGVAKNFLNLLIDKVKYE